MFEDIFGDLLKEVIDTTEQVAEEAQQGTWDSGQEQTFWNTQDPAAIWKT